MFMHYRLLFVRHYLFFVLTGIIFLMCTQSDLVAQREYPYQPRQDQVVPSWVTELYKPDDDPGIVMKLYNDYYKKNPFVKKDNTE